MRLVSACNGVPSRSRLRLASSCSSRCFRFKRARIRLSYAALAFSSSRTLVACLSLWNSTAAHDRQQTYQPRETRTRCRIGVLVWMHITSFLAVCAGDLLVCAVNAHAQQRVKILIGIKRRRWRRHLNCNAAATSITDANCKLTCCHNKQSRGAGTLLPPDHPAPWLTRGPPVGRSRVLPRGSGMCLPPFMPATTTRA